MTNLPQMGRDTMGIVPVSMSNTSGLAQTDDGVPPGEGVVGRPFIH